MLKDPKSHMVRLMQPLPIFAAFVARQLNFDLQVTVTKESETARKRSVQKVKLKIDGESDSKKEKALKEKIKTSLDQFPTLKQNRGYIEVIKEDK